MGGQPQSWEGPADQNDGAPSGGPCLSIMVEKSAPPPLGTLLVGYPLVALLGDKHYETRALRRKRKTCSRLGNSEGNNGVSRLFY